MKNPFAKKSLEDMPSAETDGESSLSQVELSPKQKVRFKLYIRKLFGRDSEDSGTDNTPEKPQKIKRTKEQRVRASGGQGKKPPILLFAIVGVVIVVGAVTAIATLNRGPSTSAQLDSAAQLTVEAKYDEAATIYSQLLEKNPTLTDAYLGLADGLDAQEMTAEAVSLLETALTATEQDPRIAAKLEALRPSPEAEPEPSTKDENAPPPVNIESIVWQDAALEKMVRMALNISGDRPISEVDLQDIKKLKIIGSTHAATNEALNALNSIESFTIDGELYDQRGEIRTLADLQHFPNLIKLTICYNHIADISGIAQLEKLETLALYCNDITDISAISGLTNLKYLYLYNNSISDLSPIAGLTALKALHVQYNQIADLSPVKELNELTQIYINHNQLTDISAITGLQKLAFFFADSNSITDISPVEKVPSLTDVVFQGNPVSDYGPAKNIQNVNREN